jgi:hypothetical protein
MIAIGAVRPNVVLRWSFRFVPWIEKFYFISHQQWNKVIKSTLLLLRLNYVLKEYSQKEKTCWAASYRDRRILPRSADKWLVSKPEFNGFSMRFAILDRSQCQTSRNGPQMSAFLSAIVTEAMTLINPISFARTPVLTSLVPMGAMNTWTLWDAQDLSRFSPSVLFLGQNIVIEAQDDQLVNFASCFQDSSPRIARTWLSLSTGWLIAVSDKGLFHFGLSHGLCPQQLNVIGCPLMLYPNMLAIT